MESKFCKNSDDDGHMVSVDIRNDIYFWRYPLGVLFNNYRLKKNKSYVSKLPRACGARLVQQNSRFEFFFVFVYFFPGFYELACQNIQEKIWQTQWDTLNNKLLQLCVLSCILSIQNQVPYFKAVNVSNLTRLLLRKKKNAFRSGLPICHELWDIAFFFFFFFCLSKLSKRV